MNPLLNTAILSDNVNASSWSCVTYNVVIPKSFCRRFNSFLRSTRNLASKLESGSSRQRIFGSNTNARASATRCCCPPDNSDTLRCNCWSEILIFAATAATFALITSGATFFTFKPNAILSKTVIVGNNA